MNKEYIITIQAQDNASNTIQKVLEKTNTFTNNLQNAINKIKSGFNNTIEQSKIFNNTANNNILTIRSLNKAIAGWTAGLLSIKKSINFITSSVNEYAKAVADVNFNTFLENINKVKLTVGAIITNSLQNIVTYVNKNISTIVNVAANTTTLLINIAETLKNSFYNGVLAIQVVVNKVLQVVSGVILTFISNINTIVDKIGIRNKFTEQLKGVEEEIRNFNTNTTANLQNSINKIVENSYKTADSFKNVYNSFTALLENKHNAITDKIINLTNVNKKQLEELKKEQNRLKEDIKSFASDLQRAINSIDDSFSGKRSAVLEDYYKRMEQLNSILSRSAYLLNEQEYRSVYERFELYLQMLDEYKNKQIEAINFEEEIYKNKNDIVLQLQKNFLERYYNNLIQQQNISLQEIEQTILKIAEISGKTGENIQDIQIKMYEDLLNYIENNTINIKVSTDLNSLQAAKNEIESVINYIKESGVLTSEQINTLYSNLNKNVAEASKNIKDKEAGQVITTVNNIANQTLSLFTDLTSSIKELQKQQTEQFVKSRKKELEASINEYSKYIKNKEQLDNYASAMEEKIQQEAEQQNRKYALLFKMQKIAEATISASNATMSAWEQAMKLPSPANIAVGTAMSALIAGVYATQLATIKAQKFSSGGIVTGSSGLDNVNTYLTSGEMVLTKQMQLNLLQMLKNSSGSGKTINITENIYIQNADNNSLAALQQKRYEYLQQIKKYL